MSGPQTLAQLRLDVAAKRVAVREAEQLLELERARAEQRCIDAKGGDSKALGANEADRKRTLVLWLDEDPAYGFHRAQHLALAADLERLNAEQEIALDDYRERRLIAEAARTDVLLRAIERGALVEVAG